MTVLNKLQIFDHLTLINILKQRRKRAYEKDKYNYVNIPPFQYYPINALMQLNR